jgi:hypothetical protein
VTESEIFALVKSEVLQTSITVDEWCRRVAEDPDYPRTITHYYKTLKAAELLKTLPPPPPAPAPSLAALAQNVMFTAWSPSSGIRACATNPAKWKLAVSADPGVEGNTVTPAQHLAHAKAAVQAAHDLGAKAAAWGNQSQIGTTQIQIFAAAVDADYIIHQAESGGEYASATAAGAQVIIGNPNAWADVQKADANVRIAAGNLAVIFETYTNEGAPWPIDSSAGGVNVASMCPGVGWGATPYQLTDYQAHTKPDVWPSICVYLAEKMSDASWAILP